MSSRSRYGDHTIPRKGSTKTGNSGENRTAVTCTGRFIDYGSHIKLVDDRGNPWSVERVTFCMGSFGYSTDGTERWPRPWKLDPTGNPIVEGDVVEIGFLHNNPEAPIVRGGVRTLKPGDAFFRNPPELGSNRVALRAAAVNAGGVLTGHVELEALHDGNVLEVRVGGSKLTGPRLRIRIDSDAGTISIGKGNELHQIGFGEVIVEAIKGLAEDVLALNLAHTGATTAPVPPVDLASPGIIADASASLQNGAPMLSNLVKVQ